ncbi:MAG: T9SS type A sorting domain-containing protein [Bacteroidales bacterium]|nr:T9SS type A sorting domain-containing protein [Bacteroidales bacterium]
MKKMFLCMAFISAIAISARGQLLLEENFDYTVGDPVTAHGWVTHSGNSNIIKVAPMTMGWTGYPPSGIGNETKLVKSGEDINHVFASRTSGNVYVAFLVRVLSATITGDFFLHLGKNPMGSSYKGKVFVRRDGGNHLSFGIAQSTSVTAMIMYSPFIYSLNTACLMVLKYSILPGAGNDIAALFINPDVNLPEPINPLTSCDTPSDPSEIGSVALRQGGISSGPVVDLDGIRVGLGWEDLFSGVPAQLTVTGTVAASQTVCRDATLTITVAGEGACFTVASGGVVTLIAGQDIRFLNGTRVNSGGQLSAFITNTGNYCEPVTVPLVALSKEEDKLYPSQDNSWSCSVFPNPATGFITGTVNGPGVPEKGCRGEFSIYTLTGQMVLRQRMEENKFHLDIRDWPDGIYLLSIRIGNHKEIYKIVKMD